MSCSKPVISFAKIVQGRDSSVLVTDDGLVDIVNLLMIFADKDCNHSNETLRLLKPSLFDKENFITRDGRRYATLQDIIKLIMVFPCKVSAETRSQFVKIIEDYIKKDASPGPAPTPPTEEEEFMVGFKRRRMELELSMKEHEKNALIIDNRVKEQTRILAACAELERINDPSKTNLDARSRLMIQDAMQNSILGYMAVPTQSQQGPSPNTPISISGVAKDLGYKNLSTEDAMRIGGVVKKRYDQLDNGEPVSKHLEMCGGRPVYVNSYSEKHRDLIADVIHADQKNARKQQKPCKSLNSYFKSS